MSFLSHLQMLFGGASNDTPTSGYRRISAAAARKLLEADPDAELVDVRTDGEYRLRRIPGSVLIPDTTISQQAAALLTDKHASIIVYCQSGMRSRRVARRLLALGYTNVYDLGGISGWPYGTVSG